jgi:predicted ATPase
MVCLLRRSMTLWFLGYPEAALADSRNSLTDARAIGHAATLFFALYGGCWTQRICGNYVAAAVFADELASLADEKGTLFWKAGAMMGRGCLYAVTGKPGDAVAIITDCLTAIRSAGTRLFIPEHLTYLAKAHSELGQYSHALGCIGEALATIETTKERWYEAEVHRTAGELALSSRESDAEAHFNRALAIARGQQAKSLELRASTSLARLWRDQGKRTEAGELLAPIYGWFTEGFDTVDLKEAKALLGELS